MKGKYINVMWVTLINYDFYANLGFVYSPTISGSCRTCNIPWYITKHIQHYTCIYIEIYTSNSGISQLKWPRFYELCVASIVHTIIKWSGVNGTCRKDKNWKTMFFGRICFSILFYFVVVVFQVWNFSLF